MQTNAHVYGSIKYGHFERLNFAKIACENDSQCIGIYDRHCKGQGPFALVKRGFMTSISGSNCIHKKKIYGGQ